MLILFIGLIAIGVALARGGTLARWMDLDLRWRGLIILGFICQAVIFSNWWQAQAQFKLFTPYLYVVSMLLPLVGLSRNFHLPGVRLITLGLCLNLLAIVFNGGYMPASPQALELAGHTGFKPGTISNNSIVMGPDVRLFLLCDIFAVPKGFPLANVFSIGDLCLTLGAVYLIQKTLVAPKPAQ